MSLHCVLGSPVEEAHDKRRHLLRPLLVHRVPAANDSTERDACRSGAQLGDVGLRIAYQPVSGAKDHEQRLGERAQPARQLLGR